MIRAIEIVRALLAVVESPGSDKHQCENCCTICDQAGTPTQCCACSQLTGNCCIFEHLPISHRRKNHPLRSDLFPENNMVAPDSQSEQRGQVYEFVEGRDLSVR